MEKKKKEINKNSLNNKSNKKIIKRRRTRNKKKLSLDEEADYMFNKFMDEEEKEIYILEYSLISLEIENENYIKEEICYYESLIPNKEKENYGWEEMKAYYKEKGWYHECDVCWENTRNEDCKCANIISKCDMTYMETHIVFNHFTKKNKVVLIPKTVKNVPILTLF